MSDSENDFDAELLELVGETEKKRKKRPSSGSSNKRRKADVSMDTESEDDVESEEDESNPYPLEGKYIDEADRQRLMDMAELEREDILAQRAEEIQKIQDKRNLDRLLQAQQGNLEHSVSKAAKRQHAVRGATKEKSRKLDELREKRRLKDERRRSPKRSRSRSSSPMEMETSDEEEEDGQISKLEQEEERDRKMFAKLNPEAEPVTLEDFERCRISRDLLAKHCLTPWFEDYVKGAWVRYLIGNDQHGHPVYRICEILGLASCKPYKINDSVMFDKSLELRHGKAERAFPMDKVSNAKFDEKEFQRMMSTLKNEGVKLPSKRDLEKKCASMTEQVNQIMTESDISAMLKRRNELQSGSSSNTTLERSRLIQARTLAERRQDWSEVAEIDAKLASLNKSNQQQKVTNNSSNGASSDAADRLARVNERNRKANLEAIRKAEMQEVERKRREKKLLSEGAAVEVDPSARLKTVPKVFNQSRINTPNNSTPNSGTPVLSASKLGGDVPAMSSLPPSSIIASGAGAKSTTGTPSKQPFIASIEVDLGDF